MVQDISPEYFADRYLEEVTSSEVRLKDGQNFTVRADDFKIVDPTDVTKVLQFDLSALPTGATFSQPAGMRNYVDTGGAFATAIVLTADDTGNVYLLDDAAGLQFELPAITADNIGMSFGFRLITEVTSNSYKITAGAADLLVGMVVVYDKDIAEGGTEALQQLFRPDVSDDLILTIAGADDTTGSLVGGWLEFEAISATRWFVRGELVGDGSLATIFS